MALAIGATSGGPAAWITILVAAIAAVAAITAGIVAAIVSARSARSTKQLELQSQRTHELENRISERKIDVYKPMIEMLGTMIRNPAIGAQVPPEEIPLKFAEFTTWIAVYGSDDAIEIYHNLMQAAYNEAPVLVISRLIAEFILAARRDIGYPETAVTASHIMAMRVKDLYSDDQYRVAMTLRFEELCNRENWVPPWLTQDSQLSLATDESASPS